MIREGELGNERFQNGNIVAWAVAIAPYPLNTAALWANEMPANWLARVEVDRVPTRSKLPVRLKFKGAPLAVLNVEGFVIVNIAVSRPSGINELLYCDGAIASARSLFWNMIPEIEACIPTVTVVDEVVDAAIGL